MHNDFENEIKKGKEVKETTVPQDYEDEDQAMENSMENSCMEEESLEEHYMPPVAVSNKSCHLDSETESECKSSKVKGSCKGSKTNVAREKWLTVTGRKPRNIPTIRRYLYENKERPKIVFFGDRRPAEVEKLRQEKWMKMIADEAYKKSTFNNGIVIREIRLPDNTEAVTSVRYHPDAEYVTTGFRNGGVQVRHPISGDIIKSLKTLESFEKLPVRGIRFYPMDKNKLYLGGAYGTVEVFDLESGAIGGVSEKRFQINNLDFSSDGTTFAISGRGGEIAVMDARNLEVASLRVRPNIDETTQPKIYEDYHKYRIYGLKFHPTEANIFATGGWDRSLKVWDVRVPAAVFSINGPLLSGDSLDIYENTILTGSWCCEESLQLWDISTRKLLYTVPMQIRATKYDGQFLYTAQFLKPGLGWRSSDPQLVAVGGSGFNQVAIVKVSDGKVLASFPAYKSVVALDTQGGLITYGGKESLLRLGQILLPSRI